MSNRICPVSYPVSYPVLYHILYHMLYVPDCVLGEARQRMHMRVASPRVHVRVCAFASLHPCLLLSLPPQPMNARIHVGENV